MMPSPEAAGAWPPCRPKLDRRELSANCVRCVGLGWLGPAIVPSAATLQFLILMVASWLG